MGNGVQPSLSDFLKQRHKTGNFYFQAFGSDTAGCAQARFYIGLPAMHLLPPARKCAGRIWFIVRLPEPSSTGLLCILLSLSCSFPPWLLSFTPEFAVSVCEFHISPFLIYHQTAFRFQKFHKSRNAHFGRDTYRHMNMVRAYLPFYRLHSVPLIQLSQYLPYFHPLFFIEYFLPVFVRKHDRITCNSVVYVLNCLRYRFASAL